MKKQFDHRRGICALMGALLFIAAAGPAFAAAAPHSALARIQPYLVAAKEDEVALARTAAPPAISAQATVLVLGQHGYSTAVKGSNGFVCLDVRSWDNDVTVSSSVFWNPKFRAPYCWNAAGARSVLPRYLQRTRWVMAGASESEIGERERAQQMSGKLEKLAPGVICYMMSKGGRWIGNQSGPWRPHLMFYFPRAQAPDWGANRQGNPIYQGENENLAVFMVLVPVWSDGSPAPGFK